MNQTDLRLECNRRASVTGAPSLSVGLRSRACSGLCRWLYFCRLSSLGLCRRRLREHVVVASPDRQLHGYAADLLQILTVLKHDFSYMYHLTFWKLLLHKQIIILFQLKNFKSETIGQEIEKCLIEWKFENVFTVRVDNASSRECALSNLWKFSDAKNGIVCGGKYMDMRRCMNILDLTVIESK